MELSHCGSAGKTLLALIGMIDLLKLQACAR